MTKSDLEARPVFVSREEHIHAHFPTCSIALTSARIIELKLNHKYSIGRILESLSNSECTHLKQNCYLFDYFDEILNDLGSIFNIDFSKRIRSLGEIKIRYDFLQKTTATNPVFARVRGCFPYIITAKFRSI
ncbi:hypothetical protein JOC94_000429 [Bacillus thermophilus]|uniref:Uncharacterized protein n=1 Tax=Siminovitchia thermophila TaxID=1245522 RepID=A0ABS2R4A4_9BACI|nr:hypothetical protein [Siminovitchia thermophila]MBM7713461.1 hypothetical protein [Siminovitchia thermophila]